MVLPCQLPIHQYDERLRHLFGQGLLKWLDRHPQCHPNYIPYGQDVGRPRDVAEALF